MFTVLQYEHDAGAPYGAEAAELLGLDPAQVFKTLVVAADEELAVAIVPVAGQLSLKATARALGAVDESNWPTGPPRNVRRATCSAESARSGSASSCRP